MSKIQNPAFDYDAFGKDYASVRREDPRIAKQLLGLITDCATVLNVGAGTGSYEPRDRFVVALEPSERMRWQRLENGKSPAIIGKGDQIPFDNDSFDAVTALVTIHHWPDMRKGIEELKRVARKKVVIMTFDPDYLDKFWNARYFPEVIVVEKQRYPTSSFLKQYLGANTQIVPVPIPFDCSDGFQEAFYGRPEAFLRPEVRAAQSAWGFVDKETEARIVGSLAADLESGEWDRLYGEHRTMPTFTCALRFFVLTK